MKIAVQHKRGIPISSRFIISVLMVLAQLGMLFVAVLRLSTQSTVIYWAFEVLGVLLVIVIVNKRGNPSYKIAWIVFILLLPIFGISIYLLWGGGRIPFPIRRRLSRCEEHYRALLPADADLHEKLHEHDLIHSRQADFLTTESGYPLYDNVETEYLSPGEAFFPRFLEELELAEHYIFMEFFIIAEGEMWNQVHDVLRRKVMHGVEVKILFDDFGSINRQQKNFMNVLRSEGISVAAFNKIGPSVNIFMNNRNHRKIVVIDGKLAMTGGLNLADEYINRFERFGYWMDCALLLRGDAVQSFLCMFCIMWEFTTSERIDFQRHLAQSTVCNNAFALPYSDEPLDDRNPAVGIYMQMINTAQRYIYITTPYLIVDSTMIMLLQIAAKSGVDVRIITPHIPDKWYVHPVTQYSYLELLEAGVRIYEYTPGFIHSKLFVSDDKVATVGTVNMDYRSFMLHFECGIWLSNQETVVDIRHHVERLFAVSKEIEPKKWMREPWYRRLKRAVLHLLAPFM